MPICKGLPLLHCIERELDHAAIGRLMFQFASALGNTNWNNQSRYRLIGKALAKNRLDMGALLYADRQSEKMPVEVCDKCKGYLKVIVSFTPTPPEMLSTHPYIVVNLS